MTLAPTRPAPVPEAPGAGDAKPGRAGTLGWVLGAAATAGAAIVLRVGYSFGTEDHLVLMAKGISWADPDAYRNDWFVHHVGQPHWFFDVVTYLGERFGALPGVYFLWWLATLFVFGAAAVWLVERFVPGRPWMALMFGPVVAAGPLKILGSMSPLLGTALPNSLGGCLGLLTIAALLTERWRAAALAAVATGIVHIQHGADLVPILVLTAVLAERIPSRQRRSLILSAAAVSVLSVVVVHWRHIESGGKEWLEVCKTASPTHCDANSWSWGLLFTGAVAIALALGLAWGRQRRLWRLTVPTLVLPAVGVALAVVADRLDVPVLGELAQKSNAYRLASYVLPLAACGLLVLAARLRERPRAGHGALVIGATAIWLAGDGASLSYLGKGRDASTVVAGAGVVAAAAWAMWTLAKRLDAKPDRVRLALPVAAFLAAAVLFQGGAPSMALGYPHDNPGVVAALELGHHLPPGAVVAVDPRFDKVRALSRRAVVADCRNIPYGGKAWREHQERIAALGMQSCLHGTGGMDTLSVSQLLDLRARYGVTHALLAGNDPKLAYAMEQWPTLFHVEPADWPLMTQGWWLFELPAA